MCIYFSVLCSLSCLLLVLDTTRDLAFRERTSGCCRYFPTSGIKSQRLAVVSEDRVLVVVPGRSKYRGLFSGAIDCSGSDRRKIVVANFLVVQVRSWFAWDLSLRSGFLVRDRGFRVILINSICKKGLLATTGIFTACETCRFDIEKFDGKNDFGLWLIKMRTLMVQQGCDVVLETLLADMEACEKATLMMKAYSTLIICLEDRVLREVTKKTTDAGIWLTSLYMTMSLANRLYLKKKLYTYCMNLDQALMLLTSLPSSYENFVETLLYVRESLTMDDVLATLNLRELKKRTEGKKKKIMVTEDHLKRDCPMNKSSGFVKKVKCNQDSDSSDDEGNAYFGEALVVVRNDEMTKLVMNLGGTYHMTHMRDFLYDFKVVDGGSVQLGDNMTCTIKGTEKGYTVKIQTGKIKVIKGCRVMMTGIKKKDCVYTLEAKVMTFGVRKHGGSKQVGLKKLGSKQVGFKKLCHKQVGFKQLGPGVETGVHRVQDEKRLWFEVELQRAQRDREAEVFQVSNEDAAVAQ
nr:retrovirus-related Pol polyprotein from transposon TNT 1-94 [Tanacetum cinerariifolium]